MADYEPLSPELMLAATRGPQVETLGDAYARMHAQQAQLAAQRLAQQEGAQRLTLGQLTIDAQRRALALDQARRQAAIDAYGGTQQAAPGPDDGQIYQQQPTQQAAPQPPQPAMDGPMAPGFVGVPQAALQPPQAQPQPAPPAAAPQTAPADDFAAQVALRKRYIDQLTRQGDVVGASAAQADLLKQQQEYQAAQKDAAQANNDNASASEKHNSLIYQATSHLMSLQTPELRAAAWPQVRDSLIAAGAIHADHASLAYPGDEWIQNEHGVAMTQVQKDEEATAKREAALAGPKQQEAETNAALLKIKLQQLQNPDPAAFAQLIDSVAPPGVKENAGLNSRMRAQVSFALQRGDVEGAKTAIAKGAEEIGSLEKATDPRVQANKVAVTVATTNAKNEANQAAGGMTADDFDRAGEQYARTGIMPQLGRDSISRNKIAHAANEWARAEGLSPSDVITMQAAYAGDKKSLEKFVGQRDQVVSFENTALKNIDIFEQAASKIPDTGVPWINTPLRLLDQKLVGSENMAAVNAARAVATNEIAKVTSGGSMSGVLSDNARQEVKDYNPKDATFAQTRAVIAVLKKDMANRHGSMDATISDIKSRIGGGKEETPPPAALPAKLSAADVGKTYMNKAGKPIKITAVNPANPTQFKSEEVNK